MFPLNPTLANPTGYAISFWRRNRFPFANEHGTKPPEIQDGPPPRKLLFQKVYQKENAPIEAQRSILTSDTYRT